VSTLYILRTTALVRVCGVLRPSEAAMEIADRQAASRTDALKPPPEAPRERS
jgi:hypothetical protein